MDDFVLKHLKDLYELNPDISPRAFQFPRLPPGINYPVINMHENPAKEKFLQNFSFLNKRLEGFQNLYQQHVSGLLTMSSDIIPHDHPLHKKQKTVEHLKAENSKLLKENFELKKKLDQKN